MKTFTKQDVPAISTTDEGLMLALWKSGYDTAAIAGKLHLLEWQVANRLWHLREAHR